jgi:hypothetical protein
MSEKRFAKKVATDTKYRIKLNDSYWENKRLKDIHHDLDTMFEDVLDEAKKNYADNDSSFKLVGFFIDIPVKRHKVLAKVSCSCRVLDSILL